MLGIMVRVAFAIIAAQNATPVCQMIALLVAPLAIILIRV